MGQVFSQKPPARSIHGLLPLATVYPSIAAPIDKLPSFSSVFAAFPSFISYSLICWGTLPRDGAECPNDHTAFTSPFLTHGLPRSLVWQGVMS